MTPAASTPPETTRPPFWRNVRVSAGRGADRRRRRRRRSAPMAAQQPRHQPRRAGHPDRLRLPRRARRIPGPRLTVRSAVADPPPALGRHPEHRGGRRRRHRHRTGARHARRRRPALQQLAGPQALDRVRRDLPQHPRAGDHHLLRVRPVLLRPASRVQPDQSARRDRIARHRRQPRDHLQEPARIPFVRQPGQLGSVLAHHAVRPRARDRRLALADQGQRATGRSAPSLALLAQRDPRDRRRSVLRPRQPVRFSYPAVSESGRSSSGESPPTTRTSRSPWRSASTPPATSPRSSAARSSPSRRVRTRHRTRWRSPDSSATGSSCCPRRCGSRCRRSSTSSSTW